MPGLARYSSEAQGFWMTWDFKCLSSFGRYWSDARVGLDAKAGLSAVPETVTGRVVTLRDTVIGDQDIPA